MVHQRSESVTRQTPIVLPRAGHRGELTRLASAGSAPALDRSLARLALVGLIFICAAVFFSTPGQSAWLPTCIFYKITGLYCPGCGTTRMLFSLVHGHPWNAFRYNPLAFCVFPVAIYSILRSAISDRLPALPRPSGPSIGAVILLVIVFTAARNIPAQPLRTLAPAEVDRHLMILSSPRLVARPRISHIMRRLSA